MEKKTFKFGEKVYVAIVDGFGDFSLVKATIIGAREYKSVVSDVMYSLRTIKNTYLQALPSEIYSNVEDFIKDVPNRVVE